MFNNIELYYWDGYVNLGDYLSIVVIEFLLSYFKIENKKKKKRVLMGIGSIITNLSCNCTIWGSGIISISSISLLSLHSIHRKLDIRLIRGPLSDYALQSCGYHTTQKYGDPALIMPLIYNPKKTDKIYDVGIIFHKRAIPDTFYSEINNIKEMKYILIDFETTDYKKIIDTIVSCKKIISRGLHGIILAETYNVETIFVKSWDYNYLFKIYDYYYSTDRYNIVMAKDITSALKTNPMPLPKDLNTLRDNVLTSFPKDLW